MTHSRTAVLEAFSPGQYAEAKVLLATQVTQMMGRKLEEDDWNKVYCRAKNIRYQGWSNLNIDINHHGLDVEQKLLRVSSLRNRSIKTICGTRMMHPSLTRSIRVENFDLPAKTIMESVFRQYADLVHDRTEKVKAKAAGNEPDMRIGWLLWETSLTEFLYFEEPLLLPQPDKYYAEWNETPPRGARKGSKSLWIYELGTNIKRYSVTTGAGIKIQPYFDVPAPSEKNLYYFRVQGEPVDDDTVQIWVSSTTAIALRQILGNLAKENISTAIKKAAKTFSGGDTVMSPGKALAQPIQINREAFDLFTSTWKGISDEHRAQLLLATLQARQ